MWDFTNDKEISYALLPAGTYDVAVTASEMTKTQKGDDRLKITFSVVDGEYAGRKIFEGYNLSGSEKAVQVSRGILKSLLKSANKDLNIAGPEEFLGIEVAAVVKVQAGKDGYADKNTIGSFKPKQGASSGKLPF